jgi:hypothetical protein
MADQPVEKLRKLSSRTRPRSSRTVVRDLLFSKASVTSKFLVFGKETAPNTTFRNKLLVRLRVQ